MERLADENPNAYKAMMAGWDAKVKATIALGAVDAVAAAPATGGASIAGFAGTLGISAAINHIIDVVATYGGEKAASVASDGDQRLGESFQKTFSYIAAMASQHGLRAALRWKDSSGKTTSKATPVAQKNRGETSKTSAPAQKNTTKNTLVNEGNNDNSSSITKKKYDNKPKERIVDTAEDQQRWWNKMKDSGECVSKKGYSRPTLQRNKDNAFLQKSREKWEIEVFDRNGKHVGVIKPSDGKFHPELAVKGRTIK